MERIQDPFEEAFVISYNDCALRKCYFAHKGFSLKHSYNQNP